jgi:ribosomal protein S6
MQTEPKLYEMSYWVRADLGEEAAVLGHTKKYIEDKKGMIAEETAPKKMPLSYPIKKQSEALFGSIKFFIKPDELAGLKEFVAGENDFLRHIVVESKRAESFSPAPIKRIRRMEEKKETANVETIDKKLEEILGK